MVCKTGEVFMRRISLVFLGLLCLVALSTGKPLLAQEKANSEFHILLQIHGSIQNSLTIENDGTVTLKNGYYGGNKEEKTISVPLEKIAELKKFLLAKNIFNIPDKPHENNLNHFVTANDFVEHTIDITIDGKSIKMDNRFISTDSFAEREKIFHEIEDKIMQLWPEPIKTEGFA